MRGHYPAKAPRTAPIGGPVAVAGRLIGVRSWAVDFDESGAVRLGGTHPWARDGQATWAQCWANQARHSQQRAPVGSCTCGLYLVHPYQAFGCRFLLSRRPRVSAVGLCEAWGRVHVHDDGFRARYARPIAFALLTPRRDTDYGRLIEDVAVAHRAQVLDVPSLEALVDYCDEHRLGMDFETVRRLLSERKPGAVRV